MKRIYIFRTQETKEDRRKVFKYAFGIYHSIFNIQSSIAKYFALSTFIFFYLIFLLSSCSDFLNQENDGTTLSDTRFFKDESAYLQALTDIYTQMRGEHLYGGTLTLKMNEPLAHNITPFDDVSTAAANGTFSNLAFAQALDSTVAAAYRVVTGCNKIIAEAENTDVVFFNTGQKEVITGECYALRAALQFDLLRLFHPLPAHNPTFTGLPYVTEYAQKNIQPLTTQEILSHVNNDLDRAEALLSTYDPILKSSTTTVKAGQLDRALRTFQMNYYAVKALQARVALWEGNYQRAANAADSVFNHLRNVSTRNQLFYYVTPGKYGSDYSFSREYIFGISSTPTGFTALSDSLFKSLGVTTINLRGIYQQNTDIRYRAWFKSTNEGYTMENKFGNETLLSGYVTSSTGGAATLPAAIPYIKLGEVTLIKAEALNELGRTEEALELLTTMQANKNIDYAASAQDMTKEKLRQLIYDEYQRDLFGEGQLFYLNKRVNTPSLVLPIPSHLLAL